MRHSVQVALAAPRYARALLALWRTRRCWYDLEAVLIETQPADWEPARREEALQLLARMDKHIAQATAMLTRRQAAAQMPGSRDARASA